ncbi:MAG TPA: type I-U CRISPR-associated helicase/endonuclease Cas3 [Terriglobales bacterium]|nr:type I-U CRISPR-associated helicase/endonuclease Cas3 [Terriglobales bacterium]
MADENGVIAAKWLHGALGLKGEDTPFPWQTNLLEDFRNGRLPPAIDIPTGLGKTSVMAIWLVARALRADVPRRLVYVVDRRAVVDQATEVASQLRDFVEDNQEVKEKLGLQCRSLPISTLRGQYVDNREWLDDPAGPAIIIGTIDMIGSRLLFEGYGVSRKMRPYHAGLLGADTLVVVDEAHLVPPFEHLLRTIATARAFRPHDERCDQCVPRFRLLTLSATGRTQDGNVLGLSEKDFEHPVLKKRLNAKKSLCLKPLDQETNIEDALANSAWQLTGYGKQAARVIVYSDSREVAQRAKEALEKLAKGDRKAGVPAVEIAPPALLVGGRRVFERELAKKELEDLGFIAESKVEPTRPAFLFATSAGEVGVDLDADHMVCDLVAWERMVQRLGRVNRRGEPEGHVANIVVLVQPKPKADKREKEALDKQQRNEQLDEKARRRVEGYEKRVREWQNRQKPFEQLPKMNNRCLDGGLNVLIELKTRAQDSPELQKTLDDATSPEPLRPALTLPLVEAWSLTSLTKHPGRPGIQPWLRGWIDDPPRTSVVWRTYLPVRNGGRPPRKAEIDAFFEAASPHTSETLETETFRVVKWISSRAEKAHKLRAEQDTTLNGPPLEDEDVVAFALEPDRTLRKFLTLQELKAPNDKQDFETLLAGATLIVDARLGGLNDGLLDDGASDPPATADGSEWLGEGGVGFRVRSIEAFATAAHDTNWHQRFRFACEISEDGEPTRWLAVDKWRADASTEDDRSEGAPQLLEEHQERAEQRARELAKALGLCRKYEDLLALAASLHDEGKRAVRWQRAFNAPKDGAYAKTEGPINQSLLDGYRHEFGSLLRIENDGRIRNLSEDQRDLVLHLIAAHHGFARPLIGMSGCEDAPPSVLEDKAAEIALRFARLQARWDPWGLAWWEALLRAADQIASRENDSRVGGGA